MQAEDVINFKDIGKLISDFVSVADLVEDASLVYGKMRPIWAGRSVPALVDPAKTVFKWIPESRDAVLHYLGLLTHEATHLYFSKKENNHLSTDISSVEKAVECLSSEIADYLEVTELKGAALEIFKFGCSLFVEICQCNCERPIAKQAAKQCVAPVLLLPLFESCPAISNVMKLVDTANLLLLKCDPELCLGIILDISRHGFSFDWIWLHIASKFPSYIIPHLLKVGAHDFRQYVLEVHKQQENNPVAVVEMHETHRHKFVSLSEVFNFLASKGFAELESVTREALTKGMESLEDTEGDDELLLETADFTLAFLFKLLTNSADVLRFLVEHAFDIVTSAAVMNVAKQLSLINKQCVLPNLPNMDNYSAFFQQMVFAVKGPALTRIFELAYPFAFDEKVYEEASRKNRLLCDAMKDGAFAILEEIVGTLLITIHSQNIFNLSECGILTKIGCDSKRLDECIVGALTAGPRASFFIRYLHAFCLATGPSKSWEVVARFIMKAEDEEQILSLSALLITIMPFHPRIVTGFIENFCALRIALEKEEKRRNRVVSLKHKGILHLFCFLNRFYSLYYLLKDNLQQESYENSVDVRWVENLTILNEWGKTLKENHPIKISRFEMGKNAALLLCNVLRWTLDELALLREFKKKDNPVDYENKKIMIVNAVCGLTQSLTPMPVQPPKYTYKACAQFASLLVELLRDVGSENQSMGFPLFNAICTGVTDFLHCQLLYIREQFIIHLFDEVLAQAKELFGGASLNVWETEEYFASGCAKEDVLKSYTAHDTEFVSLFEKARKIPLDAVKPSQMAHSGIIGKGPGKKREPDLKEDEYLRRLVFLDKFQNFFFVNGATEPNKCLCKQVALTLSDRICKDALTNGFVWDDWDLERESTPRYIAVAKRVAEIPFIWDIMFALADVYPCLWFCFPLMKSIFASLLIQFENNSDQHSKPSNQLLHLLNKWFMLAFRGKMLPPDLAKVIEIVVEVKHREGFIILLEVWKYFVAVLNDDNSHPVATLNGLFEKATSGVAEPLQADVSGFKDKCRLVIQRNISKLGQYFPYVFSEEFAELSIN